MTDTIAREDAVLHAPVPRHLETRVLYAPTAFVPLHRHTLEQFGWTVTVQGGRLGTTSLLLQRLRTRPDPARPLLERRAERALARIAALEQQPARLAGVVATAGSAVAVLAIALGGLLALGGDPTLVPVLVGAGVWIAAVAAAPGIRSWRTERNQTALSREYAAIDACTHPPVGS
ncbi:hypothetical protein KZI27_05125 [Curtobacterium sp. TC1]|uniref:hypothetical protein n=1 Tax=Curtobacterium sp. TC1 TaxID=2862880 RepID=UPI001C9B6CB5|nr:hypothetical protein [Curtobacterium sp. TC1]QZQ56227.1 hypothetical protein KZI27_05125 [Curtobacterium sp. TC1]